MLAMLIEHQMNYHKKNQFSCSKNFKLMSPKKKKKEKKEKASSYKKNEEVLQIIKQ